MEDCRISAGIILYKPKLNRLQQNIGAIKDSVDSIFVYNNGAEDYILNVLKQQDKVIVLGNGDNIGIAAAMNRIMEAAIKNGNEWLVTYDQDSVSNNDLIGEYKKVISMGFSQVGILCPQVIDERRKYITANVSNEIESVTRCITSASCTNLMA